MLEQVTDRGLDKTDDKTVRGIAEKPKRKPAAKKLPCATCGAAVEQKRARPKNPYPVSQCSKCKTEYYFVQRSVLIQLSTSDTEALQEAVDAYAQIGQWMLRRYRRRLAPWTPIPGVPKEQAVDAETYGGRIRILGDLILGVTETEASVEGGRDEDDLESAATEKAKQKRFVQPVGTCHGCGEEKDLHYLYSKGDGAASEEFCKECANDRMTGETARKPIIRGAQDHFGNEVENKTLFHLAHRRVKTLVERWRKENWIALTLRGRAYEFIDSRRALVENLDHERLDPEFSRILTGWAHASPKQAFGRGCFLPFVQGYYRGASLRQGQNRSARRARLREKGFLERWFTDKRGKPKRMRITGGAVTKIIEPICGSCRFLESYDWGYDCALHRTAYPRIGRFPTFPKTVFDLGKSDPFYTIPPESEDTEGLPKEEGGAYQAVSIRSHKAKGKNGRELLDILGGDWLARYGFSEPDGFGGTEAYANLLRRTTRSGEFWFLNWPVTELVAIAHENAVWRHVVLCGPQKTIVLSVAPIAPGSTDGQQRVRYFKHSAIPREKQYQRAQRSRARQKGGGKARRREAERPGARVVVGDLTEIDVFAGIQQLVSRRQWPAVLGSSPSPTSAKGILEWVRRQQGRIGRTPSVAAALETLFTAARERKAQRKNARPGAGYYRHPRQKEGLYIRDKLHKEGFHIAEHLTDMPGTVLMVELEKTRYRRRETDDGAELNQRLSDWPEGRFRQSVAYKLQRARLRTERRVLSLAGNALCPKCGREYGGSWQDLLIVERAKELECFCGARTEILFALVKAAERAPASGKIGDVSRRRKKHGAAEKKGASA